MFMVHITPKINEIRTPCIKGLRFQWKKHWTMAEPVGEPVAATFASQLIVSALMINNLNRNRK